MSKKEAKKATLKDLINKKLQKEQKALQIKDIYVPSMDANLTFKCPSDDLLLDMLEEIGDGSSTKQIVEAYKKLLFQCCPMLQDSELHQEMEVVDPFDVVNKIFSIKEIMELGNQLADSFDMKDKADKVKNS